MWKLEIERVVNGYKLKEVTDEITCEDTERLNVVELVIEDDSQDELKSHENLLWHVLDYFGVYGSKHDPERLRVTREKNNG